jgi:hypothetical protein
MVQRLQQAEAQYRARTAARADASGLQGGAQPTGSAAPLQNAGQPRTIPRPQPPQQDPPLVRQPPVRPGGMSAQGGLPPTGPGAPLQNAGQPRTIPRPQPPQQDPQLVRRPLVRPGATNAQGGAQPTGTAAPVQNAGQPRTIPRPQPPQQDPQLVRRPLVRPGVTGAQGGAQSGGTGAPRQAALPTVRQAGVAGSLKLANELGATLVPDAQQIFPPGKAATVGKSTHRTVGGNGPLFSPVLSALAQVERSADAGSLDALETAANAYLASFERREREDKGFKPDKVTAKKAETCRDALERVRELRVKSEIQTEIAKLPKNPATVEEEAAVNRVKAKVLIEAGGAKLLDSTESGASESFFLSDPKTKEKSFIFKPADGEFDAGYGWKKGGGAPREVVLSAVNEALRATVGLDCGVSPTTLVKVNNPSVATERNGKKAERVGAIQAFVQSDRALTDKLVNDPTFINQVPAEDIEKVALLDFMTLQMDRQASNLLVQPDGNGQPRLIPIDAGNAMPSRKAFEASRRMFVNNAVLAGDEAKKPFSTQALKHIDDLDANAIVAAMKKANTEMAAVDPAAAASVDDENIEITRRSILFLKKAAKVLTKAQLADAYAYQFAKVLDAKDVDKAIDAAIKATLDKPALVAAIDKLDRTANALGRFSALGWPSGEFVSFKQEDPERLLDILTRGLPCQATLDEIEEMVAEVGLKNFPTDPNTISDIGKRRIEVLNERDKKRAKEVLGDPALGKKMKKVGADFLVVGKDGKKREVAESTKLKRVAQVDRYIASGGDDALKSRGKSPSKMSFEEKYYESLGGDTLLKDLERMGLNPYDGDRLEWKISDLEAYHEYVKLGGDEAYVRLGGAQNKEVGLEARVSTIKDRSKLQ